MGVAYTKHQNASIVLDQIDHQMRLERLYAHRRLDFPALTSHVRMVDDEAYQREKVLMVASGLCFAEDGKSMFDDRDDVFFRLARQTEAHGQRPERVRARAFASSKSSAGERFPMPLASPSSTNCCMAAIFSDRS